MIYIAYDADKITADQLEYCQKYLPEQRKRKIDLYRNTIDKQRCAAAYMLLMTGMQKEYRSLPGKCGFGKNGKPFFTNLDQIHFNISHSGNFAVCAISRRPIGADIQQIIRSPDGVEDIFLSPNEKNLLEHSPSSSETFTQMWTVKESYFKYTGQGIPDDPYNYDIFNNPAFTRPLGITIETHKLEQAYLSICSEKKEDLVKLSVSDIIIQNKEGLSYVY